MEFFKIAVVNITHMFVLSTDASGKYIGVKGPEFDLLKIFAEFGHFTYELVKGDVPGEGLYELLLKEEADIVFKLSLTYRRSQFVDFSFPYRTSYVSFATTLSSPIDKKLVYIYPFQETVWLFSVFCVLLSAIVLYLQQNVQGNCRNNFVTGILANLEILSGNRGFEKHFTKYQSKAILSIFLLAMRILIFSYAAVLLSFLMSPVMAPQITTIEELVEACENGEVKVITYEGSLLSKLFREAQDGTWFHLSRHARSNPNDLVPAGGDIYSSLQQGFVFVTYSWYKDWSSRRKEIFLSSDVLLNIYSSVGFRKGLKCKDRFDVLVFRLLQSGLYDKYIDDDIFYHHLPEMLQNTSEDVGLRAIELSDVTGVFIFLLIGYLAAIVVFLIERFVLKGRIKIHS